MNNLICIEKFSDFPQLGRFTLRTEGNAWKLILVPYAVMLFVALDIIV